MKKIIRSWRPAAIAIAYFGLLSAVSHIPGETLAGLDWRIWDKAAHFAVYCPLGSLICFAICPSKGQGEPRKLLPLVWAASLIVLFSGLDEIHQRWVPGRSAQLSDFAADVLGGVLGMTLVLAVRKAWGSRARHSLSTGGGIEPLDDFKANE